MCTPFLVISDCASIILHPIEYSIATRLGRYQLTRCVAPFLILFSPYERAPYTIASYVTRVGIG